MRSCVSSILLAALVAAGCASRAEPAESEPSLFPETVWIRRSTSPLVATLPDAAHPVEALVEGSGAPPGGVTIWFEARGPVGCAGMPDAPAVRITYEPTGEAVDVDGETWERLRRMR